MQSPETRLIVAGIVVALLPGGAQAAAARERSIHGSTPVKRITRLAEGSPLVSDERYVSFHAPADPALRFYDSKRRRVIRGPVGCSDDFGDATGEIGAHRLLIV